MKVLVDAVQFTYPPSQELLDFCGDGIENIRKHRHPTAVAYVDIKQEYIALCFGGRSWAIEGEFLIRDSYGKLMPCCPDVFERDYKVKDKS